MNLNTKEKMPLLISVCVIGILLIAFGLQVYMDTRPKLIGSNEIEVVETKGNKENEKILTVNVDSDRVVFYSFDGGKTYQTDNTYAVSENKSIEIVLKDNEKRKVGSKKYKVKVYEDEGPTITLNDFPSTINVGDTIDLNSYAKALDSNKIECNVSAEPATIDTSKTGKYKITYTATDSNGLVSKITVELKVVGKNKDTSKPSNTSKVTYYRYRTKTSSSYDCNYYECDYLDENDSTDLVYKFDKNSRCCNVDNCTKENPSIDYNYYCAHLPAGMGCAQVVGQRISQYNISGNICYDQTFLHITNQENVDDGCSRNCKHKNGEVICTVHCPINTYNAPSGQYIGGRWALTEETAFKTECDEGEVKIGGYCHLLDSYGTLGCPDGYSKKDDRCYKAMKKTCSKTCNTESWSSWSNWSTTKVVANDNTQVETKTE